MESGSVASLLVHDDVHRAIVASSLMKFDLQDRTTCPRCNLKGNATFPSSGRPKFGIIGIVGVSFVPCPSPECLVLVISGNTIQVGYCSKIIRVAAMQSK